MKRTQIYFRISLLAAVLLQVTACKKIEQQILKDPCSDFKFCNIKSFYYPGSGTSYPANTSTFTYDAFGNPVTVTNTVVSTGDPDLIFRYDAAHRLTEFIRPYSNGQFETWSKYVYDASGRVAFDTTYVFGTVTPAGPKNYLEARLTSYKYDNTCRIIKTVSQVVEGENTGSPATMQDFTYDAHGNLVRPGITYDNKVNIHRTNKVFMFVDRDYSMNSPLPVVSYNGYNLPKVLGTPASGHTIYFLQRLADNATFTYQCD